MSNVVAVIQARMSSTRFPGKVIAPLCGMPMIEFMLARVARAQSISRVVVATSSEPSDDPLAAVVEAAGGACYRGSLDDVLARFAGAAGDADTVVRLTGDCPLLDPDILDRVIKLHLSGGFDYTSNVAPPTFPDGMDVEVFSHAALTRAAHEACTTPEREHVTLWMRDAANGLKLGNLSGIVDASALRLTVDYPDDLRAIEALAGVLQKPLIEADLFDILRALHANPAIAEINRHTRNEALETS